MVTMQQAFARISSVAIAFLLMVLIGASSVSAQAGILTLTSIGSSAVTTQAINSWTYQGVNPVFVGTAAPGATVTITISGTAGTAVADSSGAWTFTPTNITAAGTYTVNITSGTGTMNFTLLIDSVAATATPAGSVNDASKGGLPASPSALPQSGGLEDTLLLSAFGLGLVGIAFLFIANLRRQPLEVEVE